MGLSLEVGFLSDLKRHDPDACSHYLGEFSRLNRFLAGAGLPEHDEPDELPEESVFSCDMWGYSGLHHLRRVAAHLALGRGLPPPTKEDASKDAAVEEYYRLVTSAPTGLFARLLGRKRTMLEFQHLMVHSDAEGYYLPQEFPAVLFPDEKLKIAGGMVGSVPRLLEECRHLARALRVPLDLDHESTELWEAAEKPGSSADGWKHHGLEAFGCLRLIRACEASLATGAAVVFC